MSAVPKCSYCDSYHAALLDTQKHTEIVVAENKQLKAQLAQVTAERDRLKAEVVEWEDEHTRIYAVLYPNGVGGGVDRHGQPVDLPETDECIRQLKARAENAEAERASLDEFYRDRRRLGGWHGPQKQRPPRD